jgi:putative transposase
MKLYPFIAAEKAADRQVHKPCGLLGVSRSAYYQWSKQKPSARARDDNALREQVASIHRESRGTYGAPRVHQQLRQQGVRCSERRVARLMAKEGLCGRQRRRARRTTMADPGAEPVAKDLLQRSFSPGQFSVDQVWVGDISYVRTWEGWCYLATVIDLASRRVVGFAVAEHMRASLVCDALRMALTARQPAPGLIFHSDRGSQYTSTEFSRLLQQHGIRQSLSRPGQCWDNAVAESFFSTLKTELVYRQPLPTRAAARLAVFEYIEVFYNRKRIHSVLGYRSPVDYEEAMPSTRTATPAA